MLTGMDKRQIPKYQIDTKIDESLPNSQFFAQGYRSFQEHRNKNGGGLILYINEGIPGKSVNSYDFKEGS